MEILSTILGITALTIWVISFQINKKEKVLFYQILANIFYAGQYLIYGAFSAVGMNIFSVIRNAVYFKNEKKQKENSKSQLFIFVIIIIIFGIITGRDFLGIIPILATLLYTFGTWVTNIKYLRLIYLIAASMWIVYNYVLGVYIPLIGNFIELISGIVALVRFDLVKKERKVETKNEI